MIKNQNMSFIQTNDNTRLYYQDWGTGKPMVFLHAWAMNADMWESHMLYFSDRGMRCFAYDRRGHGRSERPGHGYHYDRHADDLETILSHFDLHDVTLVGHSMGGGEIIRYLTRHGLSRIDRIVLVAPALPYLLKTENNPEGLDRMVFEGARSAIRRDFPTWLADNSNGFYLPESFDVSPAVVQWTVNMILKTSLKAAIDGTHQSFETDFRKELQAVSVPALLIHGNADSSIPVYFGRKAAELLPNCSYKEYEGAPHGIFFTHFDRLIADILEFVNLNTAEDKVYGNKSREPSSW
jgi:pimeloyl-ACP methyl ester carboxylesterase